MSARKASFAVALGVYSMASMAGFWILFIMFTKPLPGGWNPSTYVGAIVIELLMLAPALYAGGQLVRV